MFYLFWFNEICYNYIIEKCVKIYDILLQNSYYFFITVNTLSANKFQITYTFSFALERSELTDNESKTLEVYIIIIHTRNISHVYVSDVNVDTPTNIVRNVYDTMLMLILYYVIEKDIKIYMSSRLNLRNSLRKKHCK